MCAYFQGTLIIGVRLFLGVYSILYFIKGQFRKFNVARKRKLVTIFRRPPRPPLKGNRPFVENIT